MNLKAEHTIQVLKQSQTEEFPYEVEKSGLKIAVFENVFSPKYFDDSELAADGIPTVIDVKGKTFLEIGAGTGLVAVKMATLGARVTATDINESAIENIKFNADKNNVKIDVVYSDIFSGLSGKKFDVIFWNIPFSFSDDEFCKNLDVSEDLAISCFSPEYKNYYRFLAEGFDYLNENGRLIMGFGPGFSNENMLNDIVRELGLEKVILSEVPYHFDGDDQMFQLLEFKKL